jgi:hypothetical protein
VVATTANPRGDSRLAAADGRAVGGRGGRRQRRRQPKRREAAATRAVAGDAAGDGDGNARRRRRRTVAGQKAAADGHRAGRTGQDRQERRGTSTHTRTHKHTHNKPFLVTPPGPRDVSKHGLGGAPGVGVSARRSRPRPPARGARGPRTGGSSPPQELSSPDRDARIARRGLCRKLSTRAGRLP